MIYKNENSKDSNLLNDTNSESSNFATRKWDVINNQNITDMLKEMKVIQTLNLKQKLLNLFFVIIQTHIFL